MHAEFFQDVGLHDETAKARAEHEPKEKLIEGSYLFEPRAFFPRTVLSAGSACMCAILASAILCGCGKEVKKGLTGIKLTILQRPETRMDQVRVSGVVDSAPSFETTDFPEAPGNPLSGKLTLVILLSDAMAEKDLLVRVDGLYQANVVASGGAWARVRLGVLNELTVQLAEPAFCGDGQVRDPIEPCDDGNTTDGDGCSSICMVEQGYLCLGEPSICSPSCGDGAAVGREECDDGNEESGDGCSAFCQIEPGFTCSGSVSICVPTCGDGLVRGHEECDDGNVLDRDGCSSSCTVEPGHTCIHEPSLCRGICGDGLVRSRETCDDGELVQGDGCDAHCLTEPGYICQGEPSVCTFHCFEHRHCPYICDFSTGECVDQQHILFVDCDSDCPGEGTPANPYCSVASAVDNTQVMNNVVILPSICEEAVSITKPDIVLLGKGQAVIRTSSCPAIHVEGANVTIEGITVSGMEGNLGYVGGGILVDAKSEPVEVKHNTIGPGGCYGIVCDNSLCIIQSNIIFQNDELGIHIDGSDFAVTNNIVADNGTLAGSFGGVRIEVQTVSLFRFVNNTIAHNLVSPGRVGGVSCSITVPIINSIIWENNGEQVDAVCLVRFSDISQNGYAGTFGNIRLPPQFVDAPAFNYHLLPISPCIDKADPAPAPVDDIDGDMRPIGLSVDMGADEAR